MQCCHTGRENLPDMRKNIEKIIGLTLCVGMLTGCAQTPESSLVKPKGSSAMDAYKEADDSVDMVENNTASDEAAADSNSAASENDNTTDSNNSSSAASAAKTTIRDLINAPQTYKSQVTDDSAKLVVNTDATVEIPAVDKISAISVTPAEVTQDLLDRITDAFFSDATLYTADSYYVQTKSEIKEILDGLKEDVANGNLDPNNWGTDDEGNYIYDIYADIEYWESEYETAPEAKTLVEGRPVAGVASQASDGQIMEENSFSGVAVMNDGSKYYYKTYSSGSDTLAVRIKKTAKAGGEALPTDTSWFDYTDSNGFQKPTEESIGLSLENAKKMVQEKVDKMGITDLQCTGWDYAVCTNLEDDNTLSNIGTGYHIYYNRVINGVPITQTMDSGGNLEDMDSTMETWSYESLEFFVDKDGIASVAYRDPYIIGETKTENLSLLPFSEIMKTYEKMMVVTNADNMEYENSRVYDINRIVLGYARIYEPSKDAHTGLLVPVWDFFGTRKTETEYDGESYSDTTDYPTWSYLTINAVDGSIIDRSLGY